MLVRSSTQQTFRRRIETLLARLPTFAHLVLATHIKTLPSDLARWSVGKSLPHEGQRDRLSVQLDTFLSWPDDVYAHIILLVRVNHPHLADQLQVHLDVSPEDLQRWSAHEHLPEQVLRDQVMSLLMTDA